MILSPTLKALSSMRSSGVRSLLMGGQACIVYGGAEFSRDTDLLILGDPDNLRRLGAALRCLQAQCVAVPPFHLEHLRRGHAVHFRCQHPAALNLRIDVMSKLRGVDDFEQLWQRHNEVDLAEDLKLDVLSLPDLVQAKKTQRDKDWPMIRRLLEADYWKFKNSPSPGQARFWFRELRTPLFLIELARSDPALARSCEPERPLLQHAIEGDSDRLEARLGEEQRREMEQDRLYWQPLRAELEEIRHPRVCPSPSPQIRPQRMAGGEGYGVP